MLNSRYIGINVIYIDRFIIIIVILPTDFYNSFPQPVYSFIIIIAFVITITFSGVSLLFVI